MDSGIITLNIEITLFFAKQKFNVKLNELELFINIIFIHVLMKTTTLNNGKLKL